MPPNIDSRTLNTIYIIFSVAVAIVGVLGSGFYIFELYLGRVALAPFITFFGVVLAAVGSFINGELNRRTSSHNAIVTQGKLDVATAVAKDTNEVVKNGLGEKTATLTVQKLQDASADLSQTGIAAIKQNQEMLLAHGAALTMLVAQASQATTNQLTQDNTTEIARNTKETAENTAATLHAVEVQKQP